MAEMIDGLLLGCWQEYGASSLLPGSHAQKHQYASSLHSTLSSSSVQREKERVSPLPSLNQPRAAGTERACSSHLLQSSSPARQELITPKEPPPPPQPNASPAQRELIPRKRGGRSPLITCCSNLINLYGPLMLSFIPDRRGTCGRQGCVTNGIKFTINNTALFNGSYGQLRDAPNLIDAYMPLRHTYV